MQPQALYDLSPLISLMLVGALLALGPVAWVWLRKRRATPLKKAQALRLLTLFLTFDLVLFGAFTRLSDSGLGCPDWPGCYGNTSPIGAVHHIESAQILMPTGPVTYAKAWIEMLHRYLATSVGALIVVLNLLAWRDWFKQRIRVRRSLKLAPKPWLETVTLLWVCLQGAFGALTVTMKLFPVIVTLHLLGALGLLVLLCLLVVRPTQAGEASPVHTLGVGLRRLLGWATGLLVLQVALGGWVSTNYAVLACSDFPMCQGRWWPDMDWHQGFEIWRALGMTAAGDPISFSALTAIHYAHRLVAYGVLALLGVLAWQLNGHPQWRVQSRVLSGLIGLQLATGLSNVVLGWPLLAALLHTGGAAALMLTLTWALASASRPSAQASAAQHNLSNSGSLT